MKNFNSLIIKITSLIILLSIHFYAFSQYRKLGITGGYDDTKLNENTFNVSFSGNGFTSDNKCIDFTLLRSSELTLENKFRYFIIIDKNNYNRYSTLTTPRSTYSNFNANISTNNYGSYSNSNVYGNVNSYSYGGNSYTISKPSCNNTIMCFTIKPQVNAIIYDAKELYVNLTEKYNVDIRDDLLKKTEPIDSKNNVHLDFINTRNDSIEYSKIYQNKGLENINFNNYKESISYLNKAIDLNQSDVFNYYLRGIAYFETSNSNAALKDFSHCINQNPKDTASYLFKYEILASQGDFEKAYFVINKFIHHFPNHPDGFFYRGYIYYRDQELNLALNDFKKLATIESGSYIPYAFIGYTYNFLNQKDSALYYFNKSISLNSTDAEVLFNKGKVLLETGNNIEAIHSFDQAISLEPNYVQAYVYRGASKIYINKLNEGCLDFKKAYELGNKEAHKFYIEHCQ